MSGSKGGRVCSVLGCDNGQDPTSQKKLSFHVFPKDDKLRLEWFRLIKNSNVSKWSRVCSEHFKEDDYSRTLVQGEYWYSGSLNREAVPSLKLPNDQGLRGKKPSVTSPPIMQVMTAPSKAYRGTSNGSDRRDFFSRVYPGTRMDPLGTQIVLNVFSQLARLDPSKTNQALAEKTSQLTGVDFGVVFELKERRMTRLKKAAVASSLDRIPPPPLMAKYAPAQLHRRQSRKDGIRPNSILIPSPKELSTINAGVHRLAPSVAKDVDKRKRSLTPGADHRRRQTTPLRLQELPEIERYDETILTGIRLKMNEYLGREEPKSLWGFWREIIADDELPNFPRNEFVELMNDMGLANHFVQSEQRQPARPLSRRNKKKKMEPDFEYGD